MLQMSRSDAELFYEGRIPAGVVNDALPSYMAPQAHRVRVGRITEKPASIIRRMADAMLRLAIAGQILEADILRLGFTKQQIADHGQDALRLMLWENDTLPTIEMAA